MEMDKVYTTDITGTLGEWLALDFDDEVPMEARKLLIKAYDIAVESLEKHKNTHDKNIQFKYYVLNYDHNAKKVVMFNIFNNWKLNDAVNEEVQKYVDDPGNYQYEDYDLENDTKIIYENYEGFKKRVLSYIRWQEWSRVEYEIGVTEPFPDENSTIEKWDCYKQCEPNIDAICHEVIRQYVDEIVDVKFYD